MKGGSREDNLVRLIYAALHYLDSAEDFLVLRNLGTSHLIPL